MSSDIRDLLARLTNIEEGAVTPVAVKSGLNSQQKSADQLPALFRPHTISVLDSPQPPQHPMKGKAVGSLEERMGEIEEDMVGKIRRDLNDYLQDLEKRVHGDDGKREKPHLVDIQKKDSVDRDIIAKAKDQVEKGAVEELELVETVAMEDGSIVSIHGNPDRGFEIRRGDQCMKSRFDNAHDARMAVDLYRAQRRERDQNRDYVDEA